MRRLRIHVLDILCLEVLSASRWMRRLCSPCGGCRMAGVHLVFLLTLAGSIAAALPLVPVWLVALPAMLQLVAQVPLFPSSE